MKTNSTLLAGFIIIAIALTGAFTLYKNSQKEDSLMKKDGAIMEKTEDGSMEEKDEEKMINKSESSRYQEYSKAVFEESTGTKRVLFFYANWCPTCRPADKNFRENSAKIPQDVNLIRVNYNDTDTDREEKDLANKYSVTYQHTYVQIDASGSQITKWNGGQINELLANIK